MLRAHSPHNIRELLGGCIFDNFLAYYQYMDEG